MTGLQRIPRPVVETPAPHDIGLQRIGDYEPPKGGLPPIPSQFKEIR